MVAKGDSGASDGREVPRMTHRSLSRQMGVRPFLTGWHILDRKYHRQEEDHIESHGAFAAEIRKPDQIWSHAVTRYQDQLDPCGRRNLL